MRCAVDFDEDKPLCEQDIKAWGEMQSLSDEPEYRESDIKNESDRVFFKGLKYAVDSVCTILDGMESTGDLTQRQNKNIQARICADLCLSLFSILDNEEDEDDKCE